MATNKTQNVRTIHQPIASIAGLTNTQILQLIRSETTAGTQADVNLLATGDIVVVAPSDIAQADIEDAHFTIVPPAQGVAARVFIVADLRGTATTPVARHFLIEITITQAFW